jgi:glycosyltransferase involved in cell wall biosynthesis
VKLSVVIASQNARHSIGECLSAILKQQKGREIEIVVADNSTDGSADIVRSQFPQASVVSCPPAHLIPQLWEAGIRQTSGDIIALTSGHCVPDENWIDEIDKAHQTTYAGVGGAIENETSADLVDWAIYFMRYSRHMLPFSPEQVNDVAADNASYKRHAIDRCLASREDGFWETGVHAELRKRGDRLWRTPAIVVRHKKSFSFAGFMAQRFRHGRKFGVDRTIALSGAGRLMHIVSSPLIPVLYLSRIMREVLKKKRSLHKFLLASPLLLSFVASWSVGELSGYLTAPKRR